MGPAKAIEISKLVKRPKAFNGNKESWRAFKNDMLNYMSTVKLQYLDDMRAASALNDIIDDNGEIGLRNRSVALYAVLYSFLENDARTIAEELEDTHNGFELWRILCRDMEPVTGMRKLALSRHINKATEIKSKSEQQFAGAMRKWEAVIEQYDKIPGLEGHSGKFDEHSKISLLLENAPAGMRSHLETVDIPNYKTLRAIIESYLMKRGVWQMGDGGDNQGQQNMEVDAMSKG